ncbi:MAG: DNA adenine methylase [Melioribacteraceae bacterium]|nr:DNA adenine methylase [Melioribacteraceae bacterium]
MIPYVGGKSKLAPWIISHFPKQYSNLTYCEVFGGGGWVLFKKDLSYLEVYNDLNTNLVNLFRTIRDNFDIFSHKAQWTLHSREMCKEAVLKLKSNTNMLSIDEALYTAIKYSQSFSGKDGWTHILSSSNYSSGKWTPFLKRMYLINARLKRVQIECLGYQQFIKKYDSPQTLFYLDPPYVGKEYYYNTPSVQFSSEDHKVLAELLSTIQGKFLLSYYDNTYIKKLYSGYRTSELTVRKTSVRISRNGKLTKRPQARELLILNY